MNEMFVAPAATVNVPRLQVSTPVPALKLPAPPVLHIAGWPPVNTEPTGRFKVSTVLVESDGPEFKTVKS